MRKIVLWMGISVDGYFEGPNGEIDWHLVDDELHTHVNRELAQMSAFLHGRRMYELMAGFWPTADSDPNATAPVREFASIWRNMPKLVFSRTLERADWNSTIVREIDPFEIARLKEEPGEDMVVGGADLAAAFMDHDLIDRLQLYVHPVVLGRGKPLFRDGVPRLNLRLVETRAFGNGVVLLRYERGRRT